MKKIKRDPIYLPINSVMLGAHLALTKRVKELEKSSKYLKYLVNTFLIGPMFYVSMHPKKKSKKKNGIKKPFLDGVSCIDIIERGVKNVRKRK